MDPTRFDSLARSLAAPRTRRSLLGSLAGLGAGLLGARRADAEVSQASCGNVICASNPGMCHPGCVCCVYPNGNSRCRPAGTCGPGQVTCPAGLRFCPTLGRCAACCGDGDCAALDDPCNVGTCRTSAGGGCVKRPRADGTACDDGDACTRADACRAGVCEGGDPVVCAASDACHTAGACDPATGLCTAPPAPAGIPCGGAATCAGGVERAQDVCDGAGSCVAGVTRSCDPYGCGVGACLASCAQDADCVGTAHCDGGACVGDRANGESCDEPSDCQSGFCNATSGACCAEACSANVGCTGPGDTCAPAACGEVGQACCPGSVCNGPQCTALGLCGNCGADREYCCAGNVCNSGLECNVVGGSICRPPCGSAGEPCCGTPNFGGPVSCDQGLRCAVNGICVGEAECGGNGQLCCLQGSDQTLQCDVGTCGRTDGEFICTCGVEGRVCCPGNTCDGNSVCDVNGQCAATCGHLGERCCAEQVCESGTRCYVDLSSPPFNPICVSAGG